jgi:hypothetical protein
MSVTGSKNLSSSFFPWASSLFLLGLGMKLLMLHRCVNCLPYFDQWEAEALAIYLPYFQHRLHFADFFLAQNEHRIFFTHVYDFILLVLNGQWDSQLQMVGNAIIHSATIAGFGWYMASLMGRRYWPFIWFPLAVAVVSLFGWENALWGFQSQFYFLLLFSLLTICLLATEPLSPIWLLGLAAGGCAILSMASGLLPLVAVGAVLILEILKNPKDCPRHLTALGICAALAFAGLLAIGKAGADQAYAAHSLTQFLQSFCKNLVWPIFPIIWLVPLNLFPLVLLGFIYVRSQQSSGAPERIILSLGILVILQCVATAIMRGSGGSPPFWRYMDTLCFLFTANVLSAALLLTKYWSTLRFRSVCCVILLIWLVACLAGLGALNYTASTFIIPHWQHFQRARLELTREFLATDNETVFINRDSRDLPWLDWPRLVPLLRSKEIRSILPACARDPLKIASTNPAPSAFVPGGVPMSISNTPGEPCLGCFTTNGPLRGTFESAPLNSSRPYLQIDVAGDLGALGLDLKLVSLASGNTIEVKPPREPGGQWLSIDVKAPSGPFQLVARNDSSTNWFAFKVPREMGRLSFWAEKAIGAYKLVLAAGILCFTFALSSYCFSFSRDEPSGLPLSNDA